MNAKFSTFAQRKRAAMTILKFANDEHHVMISTTILGSVYITIFNEDSKMLASESFSNFMSDEEMEESYKKLIQALKTK